MEKYVKAQLKNNNIVNAYNEIANGKKQTHWIWFIIPTPYKENCSNKNKYYSIKSYKEAVDYLNYEKNGINLRKNYILMMRLIYMKVKEGYRLSELFNTDDIKVKKSIDYFYKIAKKEKDRRLKKVLKRLIKNI